MPTEDKLQELRCDAHQSGMPWCQSRQDNSPVGSPQEKGEAQVLALIRGCASVAASPTRVRSLLAKMGSAAVTGTKRDGTSALHAAAAAGHAEVVALLLEANADIDRIDCYGSTALSLACHVGNPDAVCMLLLRGANPDRKSHQGLTPLMRACVVRTPAHEACVRHLLAHSADTNIFKAADTGETALLLSSRAGNLASTQLLLAARASPDPPGCPASALVDSCTHGHVDCARALLDAGACPHAFSRLELTALMAAACAPSPACATLLLQRGAAVDQIAPSGGSALLYACMRGHLDMVRLLCRHGATRSSSSVRPEDDTFSTGRGGGEEREDGCQFELAALESGKCCLLPPCAQALCTQGAHAQGAHDLRERLATPTRAVLSLCPTHAHAIPHPTRPLCSPRACQATPRSPRGSSAHAPSSRRCTISRC